MKRFVILPGVLLAALVLVHIVGALRHHFIKRNTFACADDRR